MPSATFDIVFAVQGAMRTRSALPFHFPASLTCSVFPVSLLTTWFPVAHSSVSGLTSFSAASDITAFTSAPCLISSLASEGTSIEATLPVTQRMTTLPSSSLPRDDLMSLRGSAGSCSFTNLLLKMVCNILAFDHPEIPGIATRCGEVFGAHQGRSRPDRHLRE